MLYFQSNDYEKIKLYIENIKKETDEIKSVIENNFFELIEKFKNKFNTNISPFKDSFNLLQNRNIFNIDLNIPEIPKKENFEKEPIISFDNLDENKSFYITLPILSEMNRNIICSLNSINITLNEYICCDLIKEPLLITFYLFIKEKISLEILPFKIENELNIDDSYKLLSFGIQEKYIIIEINIPQQENEYLKINSILKFIPLNKESNLRPLEIPFHLTIPIFKLNIKLISENNEIKLIKKKDNEYNLNVNNLICEEEIPFKIEYNYKNWEKKVDLLSYYIDNLPKKFLPKRT